jgi:phosphatidate cytidylyltransferase
MLKQRLLTVAVLLPLFLAAMFWLPGVWWQLAMFVPLLIAAHEWSKLGAFSLAGETFFLIALGAGGAFFGFVAGADSARDPRGFEISHSVYVLSCGFWAIVAPCWLGLKIRVRNRLTLGITGLVVLLPTWLALVQLQRNPVSLLLLLGVVWIADTAAYFFGHVFGRHKLAPAISPGKTWEGVAGALAIVTVYAFGLLLARLMGRDAVFLVAAFLGMAVFSILGDLFESWLKRGAGVKDSGTILPGHGGILDRIDGVMAALPLAALAFIQ